MSDQTPENAPPPPDQTPSRPIWLQGLVGLLLAVCVLGLLWYLFTAMR